MGEIQCYDVLRIDPNTNTCRMVKLFLSIAWHLRKARNEEVFEETKFSTIKVGKLAAIFVTNMKFRWKKFGGFKLDPVNGK